MKKLLTIAMSALMLTSCDFRQSSIPADWVGSWFSADGGWQCSLFEDVVLYQNEVWQYQSVTKADTTLRLAITNGAKTVKLDFAGYYGTFYTKMGKLVYTNTEKSHLFAAKYSVDGKLFGNVCKNHISTATGLAPQLDSICGIEPPKRIAASNPVPDGNIGTAVVRLYLRNNLRGLESIDCYPHYLTDNYYVLYSNRLEVSEKKMQLIESDRFGKMFEVAIPVDGMADFAFSPYEKQFWSVDRSYVAAQGDTVMVVVNWQERTNTFGSNRNTFSGFGFIEYNQEPFGWMMTSDYNVGDDTDEEHVISQASAMLRDINILHDKAMRVAPAYSLYYNNARNNKRHIVARKLYQYIDNKQVEGKQVSARLMKFMADSFPTADSCVLQSAIAFANAKNYIPKPFLTLTDSKIGMGILYVDENEARRQGYSQLAIDLLQTTTIAQWMNNNAVRIEKFDVYYEKVEDFIAGIKTPAYRNYLENKYKWFRSIRGYIESVYNGQKLGDSEFEAFAQLTSEQSATHLRELQENMSYYDFALPRVEITVTSRKPGTYYLYDSEYPNVAIDSLYSSRGFYVFHNKLQVGRNYTLKCDGKEKCDFTVSTDLFNKQFTFSD